MRPKTILCFDFGGTSTKAALKFDNQYILKKLPNQEEPNILINKVLCDFKSYNIDKIIITGSKTEGIDFNKISIDTIKLDELEAVANIVRFLNIDKGLVVNIGTGTSFTLYDKGKHYHISGTGLGGGTFLGLSQRLLNTTNLETIKELACCGDITKVNVNVSEICNKDIGWLSKDITASNFGKLQGEREDVACGIHSLVAESITAMIKGITYNTHVNSIILCGGLIENSLVRQLISRNLEIFDLQHKFLDNPRFGTCLGAITLFQLLSA